MRALGLILLVLFGLSLAAVPVTLAAVAIRPSPTTVRAATGSLLAFSVAVALMLAAGAAVD